MTVNIRKLLMHFGTNNKITVITIKNKSKTKAKGKSEMFTFRTFVENSFWILVKFKWNVEFIEFYIGHERMELMCTNAQKLFDIKNVVLCACIPHTIQQNEEWE